MLLPFLLCFISSNTYANDANGKHPQNAAIQKVIRIYLSEKNKELKQDIEIQVNDIDPKLKLQDCNNYQANLAPSAKVWGKMMVNVQCVAPKSWQIYVGVKIIVRGTYYVLKNPSKVDQILMRDDVLPMKGELSELASDVVIDEQTLIGQTLTSALPSGTILRESLFKKIPIIQQGQHIKVISIGNGFEVSTDAIALNNANKGQIARAKTQNGQVVTGIAKSENLLQVTH